MIDLVREGDSEAFNSLFRKYQSFISITAKRFLATCHINDGIELEEYKDVCMESLFTAASNYSPNKNTRFLTYFVGVANNKMLKYRYENSYVMKARTFYPSVSLDDVAYLEGHVLFGETIGEEDKEIFVLAERDEVDDAYKKVYDDLTPFEREVHKYLLEGKYSAKEIAAKLNCSLKKVYRASSKIRHNISWELNKNR